MLEEQMELELKEKKELLDKSFEITKNKYGMSNANRAVMLLFLNYKLTGFTRDDDARKNVEKLYNNGYDLYQIMLEYAVSSYIMNKMQCDITIKEIDKYSCDIDGKLNYDDIDSTKIVALGVAQSTYYAYNMLVVNRRLRESLLYNLINERYIQNKKEDLDNSRKATLVKFEDKDKQFIMSKFAINKDFNVMKQEEKEMDEVFKSIKAK